MKTLLEEEVKSNYDNSTLTLQYDWLDTMDMIMDNAVHISGLKKDDLNQYQIMNLMSLIGEPHKYWYGFKDPTRYICNESESSQNIIYDNRFFKDELNAKDLYVLFCD